MNKVGVVTDKSTSNTRSSSETLDAHSEQREPDVGVTSVGEIQWISLNVGGTVFQTSSTTLQRLPGTLLSELTHESPYYHQKSKQYWFDRDPYIFQFILDYYRYGDLHFPHSVCGPTIQRELAFWNLDEGHIGACCWDSYQLYPEQDETLRNLGAAFNVTDKFPSTSGHRNKFFETVFKIRKAIWNFLEDPTSSIFAQIWAMLYVLMIVASVLTLALDTNIHFRYSSSSDPINMTAYYSSSNPKVYLTDHTQPLAQLYYIESTISCVFLTNLIIRLIVCPSKLRFIKSVMNWVDFLVVMSQWATAVISLWKTNSIFDDFFRLLRIFRVLLLFRLARHYTGLQILLLALRASGKELLLLGVFMTIGMMVFSTFIYYAEFSQPDQYQDIPTGFWWAIVTMTTVGYGDVHPTSPYGYLVGALCAISGMLATGLPIPIIANNFNFYYNVAKMKKRMDEHQAKIDSSETRGKLKAAFKFGGRTFGKIGIGVSAFTTELFRTSDDTDHLNSRQSDWGGEIVDLETEMDETGSQEAPGASQPDNTCKETGSQSSVCMTAAGSPPQNSCMNNDIVNEQNTRDRNVTSPNIVEKTGTKTIPEMESYPSNRVEATAGKTRDNATDSCSVEQEGTPAGPWKTPDISALY